MSDQEQDQEQAAQVEATGSLEGDVVTVEVKLNQASVVLKWAVEDEGNDIDVLLASIYPATEQVLAALQAEQDAEGADRG